MTGWPDEVAGPAWRTHDVRTGDQAGVTQDKARQDQMPQLGLLLKQQTGSMKGRDAQRPAAARCGPAWPVQARRNQAEVRRVQDRPIVVVCGRSFAGQARSSYPRSDRGAEPSHLPVTHALRASPRSSPACGRWQWCAVRNISVRATR